jgi:hypothetical protein
MTRRIFIFPTFEAAQEAASLIEPLPEEISLRRGSRVPVFVESLPTVAVAPVRRGDRWFLILEEGPRANILRGLDPDKKPEEQNALPENIA